MSLGTLVLTQPSKERYKVSSNQRKGVTKGELYLVQNDWNIYKPRPLTAKDGQPLDIAKGLCDHKRV